MKTVRLVRAGPAVHVFCAQLDRGVRFEEHGGGDVGETTARDLLRDEPALWGVVAPPDASPPVTPTPHPRKRGGDLSHG